MAAVGAMRTQRRYTGIGLAVLLLLLFIGLRLYDLLHFPIFLDEMSHIDWADDVYARQPFTGAANGKLFGLWWMALFTLTGDPAIFLARAATALFALIGAALLYRTAALLAGRRAGLLALLLYAVQPYGLFYDRLALTDAYVTPFALACLFFCLRWLKRGRPGAALAAGLAITGAALAKATGIVLIALPALTLLLPAPGGWRARLRGPIISAATALITGGAIWTLLRWRGYDYFNTPTAVVGTSAIDTLWARLPVNFGALWAIDSAYLTQPFLIGAAVLALAAIILRPRAGLFALLALFVPLTGLLAFAVKMSARYFQFHTAFLILLAAVGAQALIARWPRLRPVMIGLALLWIATFALPFFVRYLAAPETLALPPLDRVEYITGDSAGFGLREIAAALNEQIRPGRSGVVIGLIANCLALDSLLPDGLPLMVECPLLRLDGTHQDEVIARAQALHDRPVWIVYEDLPYTSLRGLPVADEPLAIVARPAGGVPIAIYPMR